MPKARLLSIVGVLEAVADLSEGEMTVPEVADALSRLYQPDMMLYDGRGNGLAPPLSDEYWGCNKAFYMRADIVSDLFNMQVWKNPEATTLSGFGLSDVMVLKEDGLALARALWKFLYGQESAIDAAAEESLCSKAAVRNSRGPDGLQLGDGTKLLRAEERGAGPEGIFDGYVTGDKLKRVIDLWPEVRKVLGNSRFDSIVFCERAIEAIGAKLWLDDKDIGLWCTVPDEKGQQLLRDLGTSDFAHDEGRDPEGWVAWRITPSDYDKVLSAAKAISGKDFVPATNRQNSLRSATFAKLQAALDAFPAKYPDRERVKLDDDLRDWMKREFDCTQREADVFGAILAEHFDLKTGRR